MKRYPNVTALVSATEDVQEDPEVIEAEKQYKLLDSFEKEGVHYYRVQTRCQVYADFCASFFEEPLTLLHEPI